MDYSATYWKKVDYEKQQEITGSMWVNFNSPFSKKKTQTSNTTNGMDCRRVSEFRIILIFIEKCQMTDV